MRKVQIRQVQLEQSPNEEHYDEKKSFYRKAAVAQETFFTCRKISG